MPNKQPNLKSFLSSDVVTFSAHLSVTIKRLTRYKQKVVLAAMMEGMAANTNHTTLLSAIKYAFSLKFRV